MSPQREGRVWKPAPALERRLIHVVTPGDHYSPSTGSATVSVVHGLSARTPPGSLRPAVLVESGTYPDRYDSAEVIEYDGGARRRFDRHLDAVFSHLGAPRIRARAQYRAALDAQRSWDPAFVIGHNAVQMISSVARRHVPVLYAHNDLLRTYSARESRKALERVGPIIAVSSDLADRTETALPPELRDRVHVVANGVDLAAFDTSPRRRGSRLQVVFLGRMVAEKGPGILVSALNRLKRDDIHTTFIGSAGFDAAARPSAYERALRQRAARLEDRVTFLTFQPRGRIVQLLAAADVVVVPSTWPDPCPLTVLEGMAAGAAVIASDIGGIPEASGGAAILVKPGDPSALAEAIAELADDEAALVMWQASGRARAGARDWSVVRSELGCALDRYA